MKLELVRIGNSRGIRIPKPILEQCRLRDAVDLRVEHGRLVIARVRSPREGWEDAFRRMAQATDDVLLDADALAPTKFDETEWTW